MKRLAMSIVAALALATVGASSAGAAGPKANANAGEVELSCENGQQIVWVNFLASDLSAGGGVPAIVVDGDAGRVYKVLSASVGDETIFTRFPGPPPFDPVVCTHENELYGLVTLTGVFIP
jgi:hypothetical protein